MEQLKKYFYVSVANDDMHAELHCTDQYSDKLESDVNSIKMFLEEFNVKTGIKEEIIQLLLNNNFTKDDFPVMIAKGNYPEQGQDGYVEYNLNLETQVAHKENIDFREVMRIPSVTKGEKLATIIHPTEGIDGQDVRGRTVRARPGKTAPEKAGKNVVYKESNSSFYAASDGQINVTKHRINIHSVFEVKEALSMKTGNLDFIGSVIIHGDIPSGFTVKAEGDIKVFGIVEAATVIAGGSVYISEGIAGLLKGSITASENIHVGYINQGIVYAGESLYVENSIIHSECTAKKNVLCKQGNIIGGSTSAGVSIAAKDIGNRLSTKTEISFGYDKSTFEQEQQLIAKKKELEQTLNKLKILGEKLNQNTQLKENPKHRITLLRQKNSYQKTEESLLQVKEDLFMINAFLGSEEEAKLKVNNKIYPNTFVTFGKYKQEIKEIRKNIELTFDKNEVIIKNT